MGLADDFQRERRLAIDAMPFVLDDAFDDPRGAAIGHTMDEGRESTFIQTELDVLRNQIRTLEERGSPEELIVVLTVVLGAIETEWGDKRDLMVVTQPQIRLLYGQVLRAANRLEGLGA
jgi:hypothetical protein